MRSVAGWQGATEMTLGIAFVAVWFILVAVYLLWQFATGALAAAELFEPEPEPAPVVVAAGNRIAPALRPVAVAVHEEPRACA